MVALEKVIQRIEIEMSGGTKTVYGVCKTGRSGDEVCRNRTAGSWGTTRSRRDPASRRSSENQIGTGYIHRVNSRTML